MKEILLIGTLALLSLIVLFSLTLLWASDPWGMQWYKHRCRCHEQETNDYEPPREMIW